VFLKGFLLYIDFIGSEKILTYLLILLRNWFDISDMSDFLSCSFLRSSISGNMLSHHSSNNFKSSNIFDDSIKFKSKQVLHLLHRELHLYDYRTKLWVSMIDD